MFAVVCQSSEPPNPLVMTVTICSTQTGKRTHRPVVVCADRDKTDSWEHTHREADTRFGGLRDPCLPRSGDHADPRTGPMLLIASPDIVSRSHSSVRESRYRYQFSDARPGGARWLRFRVVVNTCLLLARSSAVRTSKSIWLIIATSSTMGNGRMISGRQMLLTGLPASDRRCT
jgi:hypothetical protein